MSVELSPCFVARSEGPAAALTMTGLEMRGVAAGIGAAVASGPAIEDVPFIREGPATGWLTLVTPRDPINGV